MERTIKINEAAAESDIKNLGLANEKLKESLESIKKLKSITSAMQGETGTAIVEQCTKLEADISDLSESIANSQVLIRKVVTAYREEDARIARIIGSMGGR